jgi:PAS domain S-box-containing protein
VSAVQDPSSPGMAAASQAPPLSTSGAAPGVPRILVTDDRPDMLHAIDQALGNLYACEFAGNVEQAREKLAAGIFHLALCDIHAAGESALALAEEVILEHPETAVVLVTGEEDPDVAKQAFALGVHGYLVEPFWPGQLQVTTMNALLRRKLEIAAKARRVSLEKRFQTIIDMAPIPIYAKDASHHYVVANAKADELTGLKRGELVGETDAAILSAGAVESASGADRLIFDQRSSYDAIETMEVEGVERTYKTVKFPLIDELDDVVAVCGISIDITAQREAIQLRDELSDAQQQAIDELRLSRQETVERLAKALELHDFSTGQHVGRIGAIAAFIGSELQLDPDQIELLRAAAPMHDVGKIGISEDILSKPGPLTPKERREMEFHTMIGCEILTDSQSELLRVAATIALTHHERYDGSGYPRGLAGKEIPLEGRITAVADVFDALLSERCYRAPLSPAETMATIRKGRGSHFDPQVADALLDHWDEAISLRS